MTYETTTQHPKKALMGIQYKCTEYSTRMHIYEWVASFLSVHELKIE